MKHTLSFLALVAAVPALAEGTRQMEAHEHGVGALNIAIEGTTVAMEFHAPGADLVGFEYKATSAVDLAAIDAAVATLSAPLAVFKMSEGAECSVSKAQAGLETEKEHDHDHEKHEDEEHAHDGHDHDKHEDEEHAHDDHDHDKHEDEEHAHGEDAGHSEFHAEYLLTCNAPEALKQVDFAYFDHFPNAQEVEVQIITTSGAAAFEVTRAEPVLVLGR